MFYPPTSTMRFLHEQPTVRAVYDNPAVISSPPRWQRLRTLAARIRPQAGCGAGYRYSPIDTAARCAPPGSTGR
jgi:hypothetical protein